LGFYFVFVLFVYIFYSTVTLLVVLFSAIHRLEQILMHIICVIWCSTIYDFRSCLSCISFDSFFSTRWSFFRFL